MPSKKVLIIIGVIIGAVVVTLAIALPLTLINDDDDAVEVRFQWVCGEGGFCQKKRITDETRNSAIGLNTCQLICSPYAGIWPRPKTIQMSLKTLRQVDITKLSVTPTNKGGTIDDLMLTATQRFRANAQLRKSELSLRTGGSQVQVELDITDRNHRRLTLETDEGYTLTVSTDGGADSAIVVKIVANNYFGARHGLETLSQILVYDTVQNQMNMPISLTITDEPKYPLRGLLLDTSRSYMSVASIKRTLDGLAASKMNTFHWHITDTQSFPFVSRSRPLMSKIGAYSPEKIYTPDDVKELVEYGRVRGVRLLVEYDAPAHVGEGWQDYEDDYVVCFNNKPWKDYCVEPPCGQLNPTKPGMYDVLSDIYKDMVEVFDMDMFHMGGDEVSIKCWESVPSITKWMNENNFVNADDTWTENDGNPKYMKLWDYFQRIALDRFDKFHPGKIPIVLWSSPLTNAANIHYLPKERYIIQIWTTANDTQVQNMLNLGYKVIISNYDEMYLDCGFGAWTRYGNNWCSPYKGWQTIYDNRPEKMVGNKTELVLGGETPLWTEQSDDSTVDSRLWPRAAAYGERLWSDPKENWEDAVPRMLAHRDRLVAMGINAELLQPEWCYQHEANCPADGFWNQAGRT